MDLGLVPGHLHGEPDRDVLGLQPQDPLHFDLAQEVLDPPVSVITLLLGQVALSAEPRHGLEQVNPLLSNPLNFHVVLVRSLNQSRSLLLSLSGMPTGVHFANLKAGHLLDDRGELGDSLASSGELHHQLPMEPSLLGEMVPNIPLAVEEQGLVVAALHEGLGRKHGSRTREK